MMRLILISICAVIVCASSSAVPSKQQWPQWRGNGLGVSADTKVLLDWSTTNGVLWRTPLPVRGHSSPVIVDGRIYLTADSGLLSCLDAKTGAVRYDSERLPDPAKFTASPVAVDGHLLLTSEGGDTFGLRAGTKYEFVRKNPIGEKVYASLAVVDGQIFIRGETNLFCIGRP